MFIYKITNNLNNKCYIGLDSKPIELQTRWKNHKRRSKSYDRSKSKKKSKLWPALKKYGIENFTYEVIDHSSNIKELEEKEKFWIKFYNSIDGGYNITPGGLGGTNAKAIKENWDSLSDEERFNKTRGLRNHWKSLSDEEIKEKCSKAGLKNAVEYLIIDPFENQIKIFSHRGENGLINFANKNNLPVNELLKITTGRLDNYDGWKCFLLDKKSKEVIYPEKFKRKKRDIKIFNKKIKLTDPDGNVFLALDGIGKFCKEHNLTGSYISKLAKKIIPYYKGWKAEFIQ